MFLVLNKEKIYSYIIAVLTVIVLFAVSDIYVKNDEYVETSANHINENITNNTSINMDNNINNKINNKVNENAVNTTTNRVEENKKINKK